MRLKFGSIITVLRFRLAIARIGSIWRVYLVVFEHCQNATELPIILAPMTQEQIYQLEKAKK